MFPRARSGSTGPIARSDGSDSTRVTNSASSYGQSGAGPISPSRPTLYDCHPAAAARQNRSSHAVPGTIVFGMPSASSFARSTSSRSETGASVWAASPGCSLRNGAVANSDGFQSRKSTCLETANVLSSANSGSRLAASPSEV